MPNCLNFEQHGRQLKPKGPIGPSVRRRPRLAVRMTQLALTGRPFTKYQEILRLCLMMMMINFIPDTF